MKTVFKKIATISLLVIVSVSCSKDSNSSGSGSGIFGGNIQVVDDPQTKLGYIYNTDVTVNTNGTIKITGNGGYEREFIGTLLAGSTTTSTIINLTKQTKPVDKIVSGNVVISGNELSLNMNIASDAVEVKVTTTGVAFNISGKLTMLATNFIRK
jgi:hypothetical protein